MANIFVSYFRRDKARVRQLVETIRLSGYSVWWDNDIVPGAPWETTIERELSQSQVVIVCWSTAAVASENVRAEARDAKSKDRLVQVFIEPCKPPLFFGERQGIELFADGERHGAEMNRLLLRLNELLQLDATRPLALATSATSRPSVDRRNALFLGAALFGSIGSAGWLLSRRHGQQPVPASIAVMPFANLSGDPDQAYFSDGLAEELRNALSRLPGIKVSARTSSEMLRNDDAVDAAKKLAVAHILIGSMRRSPTLIRVNAQLIDGANGTELWSQSYDRPLGDALAIQSGIAQNVAQELSIALGVRGREALAAGGTENAGAHDLYLKAEQHSAPGRQADARRTLALVDAALELDPHYAAAHVLRAGTLALLGGAFAHSAAESIANYRQAEEAARRAVALAPNLPDAHVALAAILADQLRVREAAGEYRRAAALGANVGYLRRYSVFLAQLGRSGEATALAQRAVSLDPLNARTIANLANVLYNGRRYSDAIEAARWSVRLTPGLKDGNYTLGMSLIRLGRFEEAETTALSRLPTDDIYPVYPEAIIAALRRDRVASDRLMAQLQKIGGDAMNFQYAEIYAQRGDTEQALAALDRAWAARDPGLLSIGVSPFLDPLRSDPRFRALKAKLNFP